MHFSLERGVAILLLQDGLHGQHLTQNHIIQQTGFFLTKIFHPNSGLCRSVVKYV